MNQEPRTIQELLRQSRTIAFVGLSSNPERPSHQVASYMQQRGFRIIPVNPTYFGMRILGEHCYPTVTQAARNLSEEGTRIDIVDCFRRSEFIEPVADEAIAISAICLWMQLGVVNETAAAKARAAGLAVIMDRCLKIEHALISRNGR